MPTIILRCWQWHMHRETTCGILIIQEPCQTDFHLQPCPAPWTHEHSCSSCINISVIVLYFHHTSGYPTALTCYGLDPEIKSTPSRTAASIVVHTEPRCISQQLCHVENTDAEVALSPCFSLTPHSLPATSSNSCKASPEEYYFPKGSRSSLGLVPSIQLTEGNYHTEGVFLWEQRGFLTEPLEGGLSYSFCQRDSLRLLPADDW